MRMRAKGEPMSDWLVLELSVGLVSFTLFWDGFWLKKVLGWFLVKINLVYSHPYLARGLLGAYGFGFRRNSEVKRVARESTPMMGDPLGSSRVSSQKQNREGVVGIQIGQYRATVVERTRDVVDLGSGCDTNHLRKRYGKDNIEMD